MKILDTTKELPRVPTMDGHGINKQNNCKTIVKKLEKSHLFQNFNYLKLNTE